MRIILDLQGAQSESRRRGIGRYSRNLAHALARTRGIHELYILLNGNFVSETRELQSSFVGLLPPDHIRVFYGPGRQSSDRIENASRLHAAERIRAAALRDMAPDLVLLTSLFEGFGDNAVTAYPIDEPMPPTVAVCYDLIPLITPSFHFDSLLATAWYNRHLEQMRRMVGLLAISESSRSEAIEALPYPPHQIVTVLAGIAANFHPGILGSEEQTALLCRYGLLPEFILCIGTVEPRKNLDGLIRAYALLPPALRRRHRLVATGWNDTSRLASLRQVAHQVGLASDEVVLLSQFVPEEDLARLYRACALSISPSLHEGFGLSAAEAMASGSPAIGSNTTSLPEVIGQPQALFSPDDPQSMADCMERVLTDRVLRDQLVDHGLERVQAFTWEKTAERSWCALETFHARAVCVSPARVQPRRRSLAVVMPLYDLPISLLHILSEHYDMEVITDDAIPSDGEYLVSPPERLAARKFDRVLYFPNDDGHHLLLALKLLPAFPGVVLPSDRPFDQILRDMPGGGGESALFGIVLDLIGWQGMVALNHGAVHLGSIPFDAAFKPLAMGVLRVGRCIDVPAGIEASYATGTFREVENCLAALTSDVLVAEELPLVAAAVVSTFPRGLRPALLLDVSTIAHHDARTGVQRVIREIVLNLCHSDLGSYRLEPVKVQGDQLYRASEFVSATCRLTEYGLRHALGVSPGDVFVALDLTLHDVDGLRRTLLRARTAGCLAVVVVYDLLPILFPSHFPEPVRAAFPRWLEMIAMNADRLVCISRSVADELRAWLDAATIDRGWPLDVSYFPLGADFKPVEEHPFSDVAASLPLTGSHPAFLMIGTLEPRKGYGLALDAFDQLWSQGVDAGLVIAGKAGWMMEAFQARLRTHPAFGSRLFWLESGSDKQIAELYRSSSALLMASEGEGFGLPIVEAARFGLPVIARDIRVYREVAGHAATFFDGSHAANLARTIKDWLERQPLGQNPSPAAMHVLTWAEAATEFLRAAVADDVYYTWRPK